MQKKVLVDRTLETEDQDAVRFLTKVKERLERWAAFEAALSHRMAILTECHAFCCAGHLLELAGQCMLLSRQHVGRALRVMQRR